MGRIAVPAWLDLARARHLRAKPRCDDAQRAVATASASRTLGVLSLEASGLLSRIAHLWHSLADDQIARLRDDVFRLEGVQRLVSRDQAFLSALALSEMLDDLAAASRAAALLGRRCSLPALHALEQLLPDAVMAVSADGGLRGWAFAEKKMDKKARKMERLAAATVQLFHETEILAELEQSLRRAQANASSTSYSGSWSQGVSLMDLVHKVAGQRQQVKALREQSLWDRTPDYLLRLLARALFTIALRINSVFGSHGGRPITADPKCLLRSYSDFGRRTPPSYPVADAAARSGPLIGRAEERKDLPPLPGGKHLNWTRWPVHRGSFLRGCMLSVSGKDYFPVLPRSLKPRPAGEENAGELESRGDLFDSKGKWVCAPWPTTLGASALAPRYANIIIVIERLVEYPHLICPQAKDQLYGMLPTSLRAALRAKLKRPGAKVLTLSVYDRALAAEWRDAVARILDWLSPLAHGTVRWQSERNFEQQQQQWPPQANVLLLQTLHFADREKTEAAVLELLVGLNYLWRSAKDKYGGAGPEVV